MISPGRHCTVSSDSFYGTRFPLPQWRITRRVELATAFSPFDFYNYYCDFDDINIIRFFGTDVIDLTQVIVSGRENVVILQKLYGPTTILVPIDISVKLNISAIYSSVTFFDEDEYDLRYESLTLQGAEYEHAHRTVKLILNVGAGPVEVRRK